MIIEQDVVCAVIIKGGLILAANRSAHVSNTGNWEFPGGKPREGESAEECVIRRVKEELNYDINIVGKMPPYATDVNPEKRFVMHPFFVEIVNGQATLTNHSRAEWFQPMQLLRLAWPPSDIPIIEELVNRIISKGKIV